MRPTQDHASVYTEEELRHLIDVSRNSGELELQEQQLIHKVFEFSDAEVREAMVPRMQVEALPVTVTLDDARAAFLSTGYSRLPVYGDRLDEIVGVLFRKDLDMGRVLADGFELRKLVRPPMFIPVNASLGEALRQMQASRVHIGFVVNEHGALEGILTLEDLLEEIVGEINDEYDEETRSQIRRDGETYILDGMLAVKDANQWLELKLPEDDSYTTVAGYLLARAGRLLQPGERVEDAVGVFQVERVDRRRISRIRFVPAARRDDKSAASSRLLALLGFPSIAMEAMWTLESVSFGVCF